MYRDIKPDKLEQILKERVRTTNMGSSYQLSYSITLKSEEIEKEFIDKIRCRNGNLDITCGQAAISSDVL